MSSDSISNPIQIHIPPDLFHLAVPPQSWLDQHPQFDQLAVGAFIFAQQSKEQPERQEPRFLLVQRAKTESAFPNRWEVPGGSAELSDPTVFHSVAREVFEETGLHLARFVRQIGLGVEFTTGSKKGKKKWLKLSFEIEVAEITNVGAEMSGYTTQGHDQGSSHDDGDHANPQGLVNEALAITLDPEEHQRHAWVSEPDIASRYPDSDPYPIVTDDQRQVMLEALKLHKAQLARQEQAMTEDALSFGSESQAS